MHLNYTLITLHYQMSGYHKFKNRIACLGLVNTGLRGILAIFISYILFIRGIAMF